jgi:hypothetical protein
MRRAKSIPLADPARLVLALAALAAAAALGMLASTAAHAQQAPARVLSNEELDELVGPIALYPDDLVAIVLPASTYPLQIVQAARFLEERKTDPTLKPDEDWDDAVVALLNYPEVVELMNDDLDWTWSLGEAVLDQRAGVLDAVQRFRDRAYAAGNLRSDDKQVVNREDGVIAIEPADPEVIYVPYYEPERVVVYQPVPVYHYHPWTYPVYYYPYPVGYSFFTFRTGFFFGVTTAFSVGWHDHFVHVHPFDYHAHPYYGWRYYDPFYVRHGVHINVHIDRSRYVWEPRYRRAAQPLARSVGRRVVEGTARDPRTRDAYGYRTQTGPATRTQAGPTTRTFTRDSTRRTEPAAVSEQPRQYRAQGMGQALRQRTQEAQAARGAREQQASDPTAASTARGGMNAALRERRVMPTPEQTARELAARAARPAPTTRAPAAERPGVPIPRSQNRLTVPRTEPRAAPRTEPRAAAPRGDSRSAGVPQYRGGGMAQARENARSGGSAIAIQRSPAVRQPTAPVPRNNGAERSARGGVAAAAGGSRYRSADGSAARSSGRAQRSR